MDIVFTIYPEAQAEFTAYLEAIGHGDEDSVAWLHKNCCHIFDDEAQWVTAHRMIAGLWYANLNATYALCFICLKRATETLIHIVSVSSTGLQGFTPEADWSIDLVRETNRGIRGNITA